MNKVDYEENGWHSPPTVLFVPIFKKKRASCIIKSVDVEN